ncbi:MAG: hypothetical protein ACLQAH_15005 [Limisphaerales bacterium]
MKAYQRIVLIAVVLCGIAALEARAQLAGTEVGPGSFILNFDENQNGSMNLNGTGWANHPGGFATDPNTSIFQLLYTVNAAGLVANGDVRIYDDFIGGHISDVLRFTDLNGNMAGQTADRMFFYSDDMDGDAADTGIPAVLFPNDGGGILEVNGVFTWAPVEGLNVYNGISDVPEPVSFSLVILGGLVGFRRLLWRKQS